MLLYCLHRQLAIHVLKPHWAEINDRWVQSVWFPSRVSESRIINSWCVGTWPNLMTYWWEHWECRAAGHKGAGVRGAREDTLPQSSPITASVQTDPRLALLTTGYHLHLLLDRETAHQQISIMISKENQEVMVDNISIWVQRFYTGSCAQRFPW